MIQGLIAGSLTLLFVGLNLFLDNKPTGLDTTILYFVLIVFVSKGMES